MSILARAGGEAVFSVFANDVERLVDRQAAAKKLSLALGTLPESKVPGPIRTATIKCELASLHADTHSRMDDRFCEVSNLIGQAERRSPAAGAP